MDEKNFIAKVEKYQGLTEKALKKIKICVPKNSALHVIAVDFKSMTVNYLADGKYYKEKKDYLTALASFSYAHAWLDAGARLGVFDVKGDNKLFTLYK